MRSLPILNVRGWWPGVLFAAGAAAQPATPIALHPENPRYFLWRGQTTVLVTSAEHYGALLNLDFDYRPYFAELAAHGLNHTRVFAGTYRELPSSFGITDNPLAPKPGRYICPWARSDQPGYVQGGNRFDLTRWDEAYFERLHDLVTCAAEHGIVVELTLFCTFYKDALWAACPMNAQSNVNGIGTCPRTEVLSGRHDDLTEVQLAFVRRVVTELRDADNLYYEVCNEPYFHGVEMDWQLRVAREIAEVEDEFPARHLVSLNIANGRKRVERRPPGISILNFHYCIPPDVVAMNAHLPLVIGENETGFRGHHDLLYRTEGWDFMLAGGALYNNLDYSFTPAHPDGSFTEYRSPGGGSRALRTQLGILKRFLDGLDLVRMAPAPDVVVGTEPEVAAQALCTPGECYAVYMHIPVPRRPDDMAPLERELAARVTLELPAGSYAVEWVDTLTGEVTEGNLPGHDGGETELATPPFRTDIALRLTRRP